MVRGGFPKGGVSGAGIAKIGIPPPYSAQMPQIPYDQKN